ncbi:MAG: DNA polymerase III subunit epsilon [Hyphomicrobiales bacterium]|nr:DNA polymerase III subunit epsilon [Hyphomicrobiales bacterium]
MREIVFDTETTGLDSRADRVIEIGGVELVNRFPTGRSFHVFINPQGREIHPEALAVHGISNADLADKPFFNAIAVEFLEFIDGARLIAHNAHFDLGFINAEFERCGHPLIETHRIVDTLAIAKRKHPMGPNSLDALCRRYGIDNSRRTKHGALLDSELLAEIYIELIGGKQAALGLEVVAAATRKVSAGGEATLVIANRPAPLPSRLTEADIAAHAALVAALGGESVWAKIAG